MGSKPVDISASRGAVPEEVRKARKKASDKAYRERNRDKVREYQRAYVASNPDKKKAWQDRYASRNREKLLEFGRAAQRRAYVKNPERARQLSRESRARNPERARAAFREWRKNELATNPGYRARHNLRTRLSNLVRKAGIEKGSSILALVGCTRAELVAHLERQFQPGMSWLTYGINGWHIDHIRPCASFDLTDPVQQKACFHYTNLQPLWAADNIRKGAKVGITA